ncbi:hypothetical protein DID88_009595 [Monilinia fructigena]|uniref:Major facilitator superfamily (MFS) profile domain-containing protein n=1 Tax=Monilinia fructigena TaxID=38457 RepID=A0A395IN82_9HELO|nr:hypothetical protein DID88_009595 [Monilinia fructigena]
MWPFKNKHAETEQEQKEPKFLELRSSKWFIVSTICVASFSSFPFFQTKLERRIGVADGGLEFWNSMLLTAFGLAQLLASPLFGYYADRSPSRRTPLLLGFFSNAAATAVLYVAQNVWILALSRFLQGLSAAIVYTVGFALLADTVGSKDIGQWMGYVISSLNIGMLISPTIGGIMYAKFGYASLFIVMFSLIAIDIVMRLFMIEKKVAARLKKGNEIPGDSQAYGTFQPSTNEAVCEQENPVVSSTSDDAASEPLPGNNQDQLLPADSKKHPIALVTLLKSPRIWADLYGVWRNTTDQIAGLCVLLTLYGIARVFGSSPLGADLSRAVASMEKETPGIFGKAGASGQVFSLYTSASAAGVLAGPAWTSFAFGEMSWIFFVSSLAILTATVAIPVVLFTEPKKSLFQKPVTQYLPSESDKNFRRDKHTPNGIQGFRLLLHVRNFIISEVELSDEISGEGGKDIDETAMKNKLRKSGEAIANAWETISYITEITGESGAGKTQFLLTLLLSAQLPAPHGLAAPTLYISTESSLPTTRLSQLLRTHPFLSSHPYPPSLDRIISIVTPDLESQDHILRFQVPVAIKRHGIRLLIVDSVAANYRAEFERPGVTKGGGNMAQRSAELVRLGQLLREIAREFEVAVVVANQVADRFTGGSGRTSPLAFNQRRQGNIHSSPLARRNLGINGSAPIPSSSMNVPMSSIPGSSIGGRIGSRDYSTITSDPMSLDHQQRWFTGWGDDPHPSYTSSKNVKTPSLGLIWTTQNSMPDSTYKKSRVWTSKK